ncbi:hypothetical protein KEM55_005314 [Ascosphaera atra]|nr:hypothetical protein KEM55_005314 [Ascosphaera atra]
MAAAAAAVPGFQKHCVPFDMTQLPGPMPSMPSTTLDLSMSPLSAHAHGQQAQGAWYPGL